MRTKLFITLALISVALCACSGSNGDSSSAARATDGTTVATDSAPRDTIADKAALDTVEVQSAKMQRAIKNLVVLPEQYNSQSDKRFPVLYLLHGATDNFGSWSTHVNLKAKADRYGIIIVCPDGQDSWYFDSPVDPKMQFETYVTRELVAYIDSCYRTIAAPEGRAITGLSMGGHGALWLAWRHPDVFKHCGSMSGGVDITKFPDSWQIDKRLGKFAANKQRWAEHSVINLVPTLKSGQNIIIDDGAQDFFYKVNMQLHDALEKRGIAHRFTIRSGSHSWDYWIQSLDEHLAFFDDAFNGRKLDTATHILDKASAKNTDAKADAKKDDTKNADQKETKAEITESVTPAKTEEKQSAPETEPMKKAS